jgi:ethanolaminephosphotransferase
MPFRSHWEKYNTGVLYLPWAYDLSMVGGTILYALTSILGHRAWKVKLPGGYSPGPLLEFVLYAGSMGLSVPVALRNTYRSYRDGTGKMRPFLEAVRPLVSFVIAFGLFLAWICGSPNEVLRLDPRMVFYASGTICANLSCRLIVAQMSNTRCELINFLLAPLAVVVASSLLIPGLPASGELAFLYALAVTLTLCHGHYSVCVVIEMCRHLRIDAFRIKDHGEVRLISANASCAFVASEDDSDKEDDLEVILEAASKPAVLQV